MLVRRDNTCDHVCEEDGDRVRLVSRPAQPPLTSPFQETERDHVCESASNRGPGRLWSIKLIWRLESALGGVPVGVGQDPALAERIDEGNQSFEGNLWAGAPPRRRLNGGAHVAHSRALRRSSARPTRKSSWQAHLGTARYQRRGWAILAAGLGAATARRTFGALDARSAPPGPHRSQSTTHPKGPTTRLDRARVLEDSMGRAARTWQLRRCNLTDGVPRCPSRTT